MIRIFLLFVIQFICLTVKSQESRFVDKIYGIDGFKYKCSCLVQTKNGEDIIKLSFLDIDRKEMVATEFSYPNGYTSFYTSLVAIGKKATEWQLVALKNKVVELHKEIPVVMPKLRTGVMDMQNMAMDYVSPKVEYGMVSGHSSAYVSFGFVVLDPILKTSKAFGLFLPMNDLSDLIGLLQPDNVRNVISEHHSNKSPRNIDELFK